MATAPLMPKATAVWLVDNTSLTFEQIAHFCVLHPLEVKAIADGDAAQGIKGMDPIALRPAHARGDREGRGRPELPHEDLWSRRCGCRRSSAAARATRRCRSARTGRTPSSGWCATMPELKDAQIMRLVGTTKPTIQAIRERTHWNSATLQPTDPVTLGLCTQLELDMEVRKAAQGRPAAARAAGRAPSLRGGDDGAPRPRRGAEADSADGSREETRGSPTRRISSSPS